MAITTDPDDFALGDTHEQIGPFGGGVALVASRDIASGAELDSAWAVDANTNRSSALTVVVTASG